MTRLLIGKKIAMTQIFTEDGEVVPVTAIEAGPCTVVRVKTKEGKDGYNAVQLGFGEVHKSERDDEVRYRMNKPELGHFHRQGTKPFRHLKEFRLTDSEVDQFSPGQIITVADFMAGEVLRIKGKSKGRGYQGVVRRYGFKGSRASHGASHENHRHPGSIGASADPSRVFKGTRLPGHMGNDWITLKKVVLVDVLPDQNLLLLKGSLPGSRGNLIFITAE